MFALARVSGGWYAVFMFIAHLPAGYLLLKALRPKKERHFLLWAVGLFFSIAPDLDLFWFYLVSDRRIPHHQYITHQPWLWAALFGAGLLLSLILRKPSWRIYLGVGFAAIMLHLVLDSIAGEIYWLAPFSYFHFNAVPVPARYDWWVWNFILHWTFSIEIAICLAAGLLLYRSRGKPRKTALLR